MPGLSGGGARDAQGRGLGRTEAREEPRGQLGPNESGQNVSGYHVRVVPKKAG